MTRKRGLHRLQARALIGTRVKNNEVSLEVTFRLIRQKSLKTSDAIKLS